MDETEPGIVLRMPHRAASMGLQSLQPGQSFPDQRRAESLPLVCRQYSNGTLPIPLSFPEMVTGEQAIYPTTLPSTLATRESVSARAAWRVRIREWLGMPADVQAAKGGYGLDISPGFLPDTVITIIKTHRQCWPSFSACSNIPRNRGGNQIRF